MSNSELRIGWGEPISLSAEDADRVRNLLERVALYEDARKRSDWSLLRNLFIPPLEECEETRETITRTADLIENITEVPSVDDPEYEGFQLKASKIICSAVDAFNSRPNGCEMQMSGDDDYFACDRCDFFQTTAISD